LHQLGFGLESLDMGSLLIWMVKNQCQVKDSDIEKFIALKDFLLSGLGDLSDGGNHNRPTC
jgi:hypothetical protein